MTDARERLEQVIANALNDGWQHEAGRLADKLLAAGVTLAPEPPAPRPVWPRLEGEGLEWVQRVFDAAYDDAVRAGQRGDDAIRAARTAQAAHLWRALVASLPRVEWAIGDNVRVGGYHIPRTALAALADPYDGGGKGWGSE